MKIVLVFVVGMIARAQPVSVEEIVARVNGRIITRSELAGSSAGTLADQIERLLLIGRAAELNINVESELEKRFVAYQRVNGLSDPENSADFKQGLRESLLAQRVLAEEVYRPVWSSISNADARRYYEQHRSDFVRREAITLREIRVSDAARAALVMARLREGDRFEELAREYSENQQSATEGGLLGTFRRGELLKSLEDAVFGRPRNFIAGPIDVDGHFEILRVDDRAAEGQASFEESRDEITGILAQRAIALKFPQYLAGLRQRAFLREFSVNLHEVGRS